MKNTFSTLIALMSILFIQGCACTNSARDEWQNPKYQTLFSLSDNKMTAENLILSCGEPDYIISPEDFIKRANCEDKLCEYIIKELVEGYLRTKYQDNKSKSIEYCKAYRFDEKCVLLLYDESLHFDKPYKPGLFTMCANVGFTCFGFFIEEGYVVGGTTFHQWKGLKGL